jgi:hypothetical protein
MMMVTPAHASTQPSIPIDGRYSTLTIKIYIPPSPKWAHDIVLNATIAWNRAQLWNLQNNPTATLYTFAETDDGTATSTISFTMPAAYAAIAVGWTTYKFATGSRTSIASTQTYLTPTVFNDAQAAEIEAMTAQIIPTDSTPGAREAHCVYFIDRALSTFVRDKQQAYVQGLQDLQAKTQQLYPDAGKFSALTSDQQIKVLTAIEKTPFFEMVRTHTIIGFLSRPVHGGNNDKVGWKLIGYDDSLNHKPPFGYYDAQELTKS